MQITEKMRAQVLDRAGRRCECMSGNCRRHRKGGRCEHGLRGDKWKIYWRTEAGTSQAWNVEAWCLECFANNFTVPGS